MLNMKFLLVFQLSGPDRNQNVWQNPRHSPKFKEFKSQVTENAREQVLKRETQVREKTGSMSMDQIIKDLRCHPYEIGSS